MPETIAPTLERRLKAQLLGEVLFDRFTRGRYATDASHYQIMPIGVVVPRTMEEAERALALAREEGVSVLPRGGGTSQGGQTVNALAGHRLLEASRPSRRARRRRPALRGRARHRARRAQPPAQAARAVVSGRHLDRLARHHRRHGRQQFLRRALAALRQHARERASRSTRCWPTAARAHFGPAARDLSDLPANSPLRAAGAQPARRSARAKPTRSRRASRRCSAGSAATISTRSRPAATISISRISWSARKARSRFSTRSS